LAFLLGGQDLSSFLLELIDPLVDISNAHRWVLMLRHRFVLLIELRNEADCRHEFFVDFLALLGGQMRHHRKLLLASLAPLVDSLEALLQLIRVVLAVFGLADELHQH